MQKCIQGNITYESHITTVTSISTIRATSGHILLPAEAHTSVSTVTTFYYNMN